MFLIFVNHRQIEIHLIFRNLINLIQIQNKNFNIRKNYINIQINQYWYFRSLRKYAMLSCQKSEHQSIYQRYFTVYIAIGIILIVFNVMIANFVFMDPIYQYKGGESKFQAYACQQREQCIVMNNFTATFKNRLLCGNRVKRQTIQSSIVVIYQVKQVFQSDGISRRKYMLLDYLFGILMLIFLIYGIQRNNYIMMIAGQVFSGPQNYFATSFKRIFCFQDNLKIFKSLMLIGLSNVFFYFGIQGSMQNQGFSFGVNMLIVGFTQFAGFFVAAPKAKGLKRKPGFLVSTTVSSIFGLLFIMPVEKQIFWFRPPLLQGQDL